MDPHLTVSSSPHVHCGASVRGVMLDVVIALLPATAAGVWFFGARALAVVAVCVAAAVATEALCRLAMRRDQTVGDLSAVVTGLLLALNLPPTLPLWQAALGSVVAIAVAKQVFGGLGYNPFNPALVGRAFLLISFTGAMTTWTASAWSGVDALATATPLAMPAEYLNKGLPLPFAWDGKVLWNLFIGNVNGCIGETSAAAILLGGLYLLLRRVITWHIPAAFLGTVAAYAAVYRAAAGAGASLPVAVHLCSGGLMLAAWFMATDMVTTPVTRRGALVFGVGCGILTMVIRTVPGSAYPEGASFSILIMNAVTPLIDKATRPRRFGQTKAPTPAK